MKIILTLKYILIIFFLESCISINKPQVSGVYGIDKYAIRDTSVNTEIYPLLEIQENGDFKLINLENTSKVMGKWRVVKFEKENILVEFELQGKKIQVWKKGNVFYFEYPNDFYFGRFKIILYVKKNNDNISG